MAKSRFLRVGGSAWELKIDTERFQDKENNDLEEESDTRSEKYTHIVRKRSLKQVFNLRSFFSGAFAWVGWGVGGRGPPFRRAPACPDAP